jgi:hypothetical protein
MAEININPNLIKLKKLINLAVKPESNIQNENL